MSQQADTTTPASSSLTIPQAQYELRQRFVGGFYGQLVSAILWFASAALSTFLSQKSGIILLVLGGFFIFPATEALLKVFEKSKPLSPGNSLKSLGMQVAFVLPLSMPLLFPVCAFKTELFYPAMMVLVGAHYLPFVFLYGMKIFAPLAALLVTLGVMMILYFPAAFSTGAWITAPILLAFAVIGQMHVKAECKKS